MKVTPYEPAFPVQETETQKVWDGMDLRTYIATAALKGLLSNEVIVTDAMEPDIADLALSHADALLAKLNAPAKKEADGTSGADIVEQLRSMAACAPFADNDGGIPEIISGLREAADEIERLRAECDRAIELKNNQIQTQQQWFLGGCDDMARHLEAIGVSTFGVDAIPLREQFGRTGICQTVSSIIHMLTVEIGALKSEIERLLATVDDMTRERID